MAGSVCSIMYICALQHPKTSTLVKGLVVLNRDADPQQHLLQNEDRKPRLQPSPITRNDV